MVLGHRKSLGHKAPCGTVGGKSALMSSPTRACTSSEHIGQVGRKNKRVLSPSGRKFRRRPVEKLASQFDGFALDICLLERMVCKRPSRSRPGVKVLQTLVVAAAGCSLRRTWRCSICRADPQSPQLHFRSHRRSFAVKMSSKILLPQSRTSIKLVLTESICKKCNVRVRV
jgi:hypothetical protein